jgi:hypothetical protein
MHVYVAKAPAGSTAFGAPVEVSDPASTSALLYDAPWITVTSKGTVLVAYKSKQTTGEINILASRSTDGIAWQRSVVVSDSLGTTDRNLPFLCTSPGGSRLWVTYVSYDVPPREVRMTHSDDDGVTWASEVLVSAQDEVVAYDNPECVAGQNDVWISYSTTSALRLAHSGDGGLTIASHTDAQDPAAGGQFAHPQIAREAGGAIDLTYYAGDGTFRRSRAAVPAMGFAPSVVVDAPITLGDARGAPRWLGDYTGIFTRGGALYTSYAVNKTGSSHIAFAKAKVQ